MFAMLSKKSRALAVVVSFTPLVFAASSVDLGAWQAQEPSADAARAGDSGAPRTSQQDETLRLREMLRAAEEKLEAAEKKAAIAAEQLEASLDLIVESSPCGVRNCNPDRTHWLLTYYQWMESRGHRKQAAAMLGKAVESVGDDSQRLNRCAWDLMTKKETEGKFDLAALAFVERMQSKSQELPQPLLDTAALAYYLNGRFEQAVALQKEAISRGGDEQEYRRRLRVYEVALGVASRASEARPGDLTRSETQLARVVDGGDETCCKEGNSRQAPPQR